MKNLLERFGMTAILVSFLLCGTALVFAADFSQAKVLNLQGEAKFLKAGASEWQVLEPSMIFSEGDAIKTAVDSEVRLELSGNAKTAEVIVRPDSEFTFKTLRHDAGTKIENTLLDITVGGILIKAEKLVGDSKFEVKTPTSIVGIRGTIFEVNVSKS